MSADLWTPHPTQNTRSKTTIHTNEMRAIANLDAVASKYDLVLACARCHREFHGQNAPGDATFSISCDCRELRA